MDPWPSDLKARWRGSSNPDEGLGSEEDLVARARTARQQELKTRRRITKALAAKRSRKQHGLYVQQLSEEAETLSDACGDPEAAARGGRGGARHDAPDSTDVARGQGAAGPAVDRGHAPRGSALPGGTSREGTRAGEAGAYADGGGEARARLALGKLPQQPGRDACAPSHVGAFWQLRPGIGWPTLTSRRRLELERMREWMRRPRSYE